MPSGDAGAPLRPAATNDGAAAGQAVVTLGHSLRKASRFVFLRTVGCECGGVVYVCCVLCVCVSVTGIHLGVDNAGRQPPSIHALTQSTTHNTHATLFKRFKTHLSAVRRLPGTGTLS